MPDSQLRRRCLAELSTLFIPRPFSLEEFRAALEGQRSRPLNLVPTSTAPACTGVWLATAKADYIFYERRAAPLLQVHIVGHEVGHMLFGHAGPPATQDDLARLLFPHLAPGLVRSMLARSDYTRAEEQEAEMFASLLLEQIAPDLLPSAPVAAVAALRRAEAVFGRSPGKTAR
jgi:hypothetical protein